MKFRAAIALVATLSLTVVGLSACAPAVTQSSASSEEVSTELRPFYTQTLVWRECGEALECATATAPIDWSNPQGASLSLALVRHRAPAATRLGSLFVNPGGPGASGVDFISESLDYAVNTEILSSFDIIGFDPRGIGQSTPVTCYSDEQMDAFIYGLPKAARGTEAAIDEYISETTKFAQACAKNTGELLGFVDSVSTARDLDMLRATVGDAKLNYLGYSYGTFIGAMYAQTFPSKVGHLILDAAVDPSVESTAATLAQAKGFEMALNNYLMWCFSQSDCPFASNLASARAHITRLLTQADVSPIENTDGRWLGADALVTAIIAPLYSKDSWKYLNRMFDELINAGTVETAFALADWYNDRNEDGSYATNQNSAYTAVSCLDASASPRSTWMAAAAELKKQAPLIGPYFAFSEVSCSVWPVKPVIATGALGPTGDAPILVIGTTGDPATPIAWADSLAKQLTNGRLIRYTGEGHAAYNRGSSCVNDIVHNYLRDIEVPAVSATC